MALVVGPQKEHFFAASLTSLPKYARGKSVYMQIKYGQIKHNKEYSRTNMEYEHRLRPIDTHLALYTMLYNY